MELSERLLLKIIQYMRSKEGFTTENIEENHSSKVILQDVMGFRYEITVKTLGRTHEDRGMFDKTLKLDFTEAITKGR